MIKFVPSPENSIVWNDLNQFIQNVERPSKKKIKRVADAIRWGFAENFADERAGDLGNWEPLASRTIDERISQGYPGENPILVRSGDYKESFTNQSDPDHVELLEYSSDGWDLFVGSQDERVDILEDGGWNGAGFVPPRPVLYLGADQQQLLARALDEFFMNLA